MISHSRRTTSTGSSPACKFAILALVIGCVSCGVRPNPDSARGTDQSSPGVTLADVEVAVAETASTIAPTSAPTPDPSSLESESTTDPCLMRLVDAEPAVSVGDEPVQVEAVFVDGWLVVDMTQNGMRISRGCTDAFKVDPKAVYALVATGINTRHVVLVSLAHTGDNAATPTGPEVLTSTLQVATTDREVVIPDVPRNADLERLILNQSSQQTATFVLHSDTL